MMLRSYSYMDSGLDIAFFYEAWEEVNKLKWYFYKFAGTHADEVMQATVMHVLSHFNPEKGSINTYVKRLARDMSRYNSKTIPVDFMEQTVSKDKNVEKEEVKANIDTGRVNDFSDELCDEYELRIDRKTDVVNVALEFMDKFIMLCEALIAHNTSTKYYPEPFVKQCMRINSKCLNFNALCLEVYKQYGSKMQEFINLETSSDWFEADYPLLNNSYTKKVKLINVYTHDEVDDADTEVWKVFGKVGTSASPKRIIRTRYYELWETLCDLIDAKETNQLKFIIDNSYVIYTLGGSLSILNPDLYSMYDLVRSEILTNIVRFTGGKILSVGSEYIYLICPSELNITERKLDVNLRDIQYEFNFEDITDTIL